MEHLTSLDLDYEIDENDLEDIEDDEDYQETPKADRKPVKLSSILPKPSPKGTPKAAPKGTPQATPTPTTSGKRGR